jgi:hypothetical protein
MRSARLAPLSSALLLLLLLLLLSVGIGLTGLTERCRDSVEEHGAEAASWGYKRISVRASFGSGLASEWLGFQHGGVQWVLDWLRERVCVCVSVSC